MPLNRPTRRTTLALALGLAACTPAAFSAGTDTTLGAYQWQLESATDATGAALPDFFPAPGKPLGLRIADGRVNVTGGCNRISAGYVLAEPARMQLRPGISTKMACPPAQARADAAMAGFLSGDLQVAIDGEPGAPRLRLSASNGKVLGFTGTPTPETRFGGPGTRAFLEVSTLPCAAPAGPACLRVRERHFDENGIAREPHGEWRDLPGGIEGYAPVADEEHVVRVKRYAKAGSAGEAASEHFVFDMLVETRTTR